MASWVMKVTTQFQSQGLSYAVANRAEFQDELEEEFGPGESYLSSPSGTGRATSTACRRSSLSPLFSSSQQDRRTNLGNTRVAVR
ncbi:unnamed protein product [Oncorhynchus mykiss]|uniref:Uncharacterized protein n=1 Tax=Oncorhynchus mykiss TaxID=8022 RepID=A0A060X9W6_ONCMY|nr:unnamed protein product [Oncorhynchus mykiss]